MLTAMYNKVASQYINNEKGLQENVPYSLIITSYQSCPSCNVGGEKLHCKT